MRAVGQDRSPGGAARWRDGPGVAAQRETVDPALFGIEHRFLHDIEGRRAGRRIEQAQVGLAHRRDVEYVGNGKGPGGAQRRYQLVGVEQPTRRELRSAYLVVGIAHAGAAALHQVADIPVQRDDPQYPVFQRQLRRIGRQFVDPRVHPRDIAARAFEHIGRQGRKLGVDIAAIVEKPRRPVGGDEAWAEGFGHPPHVAAMLHVDLEQTVAGDQITLPEKGVVERGGADMQDAQLVLDHLDRRARAGKPDIACAALYPRAICPYRKVSGGAVDRLQPPCNLPVTKPDIRGPRSRRLPARLR